MVGPGALVGGGDLEHVAEEGGTVLGVGGSAIGG